MLKVRVISLLTFNNGILYRTKRFRPDYRYTNTQIDFWGVDEIIVLDVTRDGRGNLKDILGEKLKEAFVPISAGGGVRSMEDVKRLFREGADKIVINTAALDRPEFISEISNKFGSQAVVLSIDAKDNRVFVDCGRRETEWTPIDWAREGASRGAGEILIMSMDRDGSLIGYDLELCGSVAKAVNVPVIFAGGAGKWEHFEQGIRAGASAVATQCIYHFTIQSMTAAKTYMSEHQIPVRL